MLGFGKKEEIPRETLAREMREREQAMRQGETPDKGAVPAGVCKPCVFAVGFIISTAALAALNLRGSRELPFALPGMPHFEGDKTQSAVLTAAVQALALCAAAGLLPFTAKLWTRLRDQTHANLYLTVWGTSVCLPFLYFFVKDFFWPLLLDVFSIFS